MRDESNTNPGRAVGIILGIIILASTFILPFGTYGDTFFALAKWNMENLGAIQEAGDQALIALVYVTVVSFILLVISGIVGFFPLGCGVIGVIALALLTIGHILIYNSYGETFNITELGVGYFVAWAASIGALAASFWRKGQKQQQQQTVNVTVVNQPQTPPPPPPPA